MRIFSKDRSVALMVSKWTGIQAAATSFPLAFAKAVY